MLPYTYTVVRQACIAGIPIMRPLVLEFPHDPTVFNISDEYLFGSEILVAPILDQGATQRQVYLPAGEWIDFWNEAAYTGPQWIEVQAPLDTLPLFIRGGGIIPLGPDVQYSSQLRLDPLTIEVYRGANRSFTLYEDDGETSAYQNGAFAETAIEVIEGAEVFTCRIGETGEEFEPAKSERTVIMKIHRLPPVRAVKCDTLEIAPMADAESFESVQAGWWWDQTRRLLTIKFRRKTESVNVQMS